MNKTSVHSSRYLLATASLALALLAAPSAVFAADFGSGNMVACYIKDRARPAMSGWTMLWKDGKGRAKSCQNVMPGCHDMKKKWGGKDVCCTLQNGDKKIVGKRGDACLEKGAAKPQPSGPVGNWEWRAWGQPAKTLHIKKGGHCNLQGDKIRCNWKIGKKGPNHVIVFWDGMRRFDTMTLSADGKAMTGHPNNVPQRKHHARRK